MLCRYFDYYNLERCNNWIVDEKNRQIEKKEKMEKTLSDEYLDGLNKKKTEIGLKKARKALENIESLEGVCGRK